MVLRQKGVRGEGEVELADAILFITHASDQPVIVN